MARISRGGCSRFTHRGSRLHLSQDPFAARAVNDEHPDLVEHYRKLLVEQWHVHRALAERFGDAGDHALDPQMLKQLQTLGYTR